MASGEISESGRQERFARWEQLGVSQVKQDLLNGGHRVVGGPPAVQALAWEWVRLKEKEPVKRFDVQAAAIELLKEINRVTQGSLAPVVLEELRNLHLQPEQAKQAFQYLKSKGLIEANFKIFHAARLSAAGHDAILAESTREQPKPALVPVPEPKKEMITLRPGIWGVSIDLKEAASRFRNWIKS